MQNSKETTDENQKNANEKNQGRKEENLGMNWEMAALTSLLQPCIPTFLKNNKIGLDLVDEDKNKKLVERLIEIEAQDLETSTSIPVVIPEKFLRNKENIQSALNEIKQIKTAGKEEKQIKKIKSTELACQIILEIEKEVKNPIEFQEDLQGYTQRKSSLHKAFKEEIIFSEMNPTNQGEEDYENILKENILEIQGIQNQKEILQTAVKIANLIPRGNNSWSQHCHHIHQIIKKEIQIESNQKKEIWIVPTPNENPIQGEELFVIQYDDQTNPRITKINPEFREINFDVIKPFEEENLKETEGLKKDKKIFSEPSIKVLQKEKSEDGRIEKKAHSLPSLKEINWIWICAALIITLTFILLLI